VQKSRNEYENDEILAWEKVQSQLLYKTNVPPASRLHEKGFSFGVKTPTVKKSVFPEEAKEGHSSAEHYSRLK